MEDTARPGFGEQLRRLHADKLGALFARALVERAIRTELGVEAGETSALHLLFLLPTVDGEAVEVLGTSDELSPSKEARAAS